MEALIRRTARFFIQYDFWLFGVVFFASATLQATFQDGLGWAAWFSLWGSAALVYSPMVLFAAFRGQIREKVNRWAYWLFWGLVMLVYPTLWSMAAASEGMNFGLGENPEVVSGIQVYLVITAVLLEVQHFLRRPTRLGKWLGSVRPDSVLLLGLVGLSVVVSLATLGDGGDALINAVAPVGEEGSALRIGLAFFSLLVQILLGFLGGYLLFFLSRHFLVGLLMQHRGILFFLFGAIGLVAVLYPLIFQVVIHLPFVRHYLPGYFGGGDDPFSDDNLAITLTVLTGTLPLVFGFDWFHKRNRIVRLEKEKSRTELELLRQQINPHFFFNTLNNLYALSIKGASETPEVILKLSDLMRYVIYKGREDRVSLQEEVAYVQDYADLQRIRLAQPLDFQFRQEANGAKVPPLLLVVLVENAFKHGIEPAGGAGFLHLHLAVDRQKLIFRCENSVPPLQRSPGGVGLQDLRRRLQLLYGEAARLETSDLGDRFVAQISLPLE